MADHYETAFSTINACLEVVSYVIRCDEASCDDHTLSDGEFRREASRAEKNPEIAARPKTIVNLLTMARPVEIEFEPGCLNSELYHAADLS